MEYKINSGIWGSMFGVPCIVADNLLKLADGNNLKVLLYLLRNSGTTVKTEEISASTGVSAQQVDESILFWEQFNIFSPENSLNKSNNANNIMTAPSQTTVNKQPVKTKIDVEVTAKPITPATAAETAAKNIRYNQSKINYSPSQLTKIQQDNAALAELLQMIQGMVMNPNYALQNSIIWIYEYLGLKIEVIMTIITYCKSIDKINVKYIEQIAINWAENEIDTLDRAIAEVDRLAESRTYNHKIMKIFQMQRKPTTSQQEFVDEWQKIGYDDDLLKYAYEIAVENTGNLSFPYINKILLNWSENGITTLDAAKNASSEHKKNHKPKADNSDGFDADEYEMFLNNF